MTVRSRWISLAAMAVAACSDVGIGDVAQCDGIDGQSPVGAPAVTPDLAAATTLDCGAARVPLTVSVAIPCLSGGAHARLSTSAGGLEADGGTAEQASVLLTADQGDGGGVVRGHAAVQVPPGVTAFLTAEVGDRTGSGCVSAPADGGHAVDCAADGGTAP